MSESWLKSCSRFLKLDPFYGWLSQTIALTLRLDWDNFKAIIIKQTNPLHNSPSLLWTMKSPLKYSSYFCKYILPNIRYTLLEIVPSFLRVCAHLTVFIVPWLLLCNNDNDGNRKYSSSIRCEWIDVYHNNNAYLTNRFFCEHMFL